MKVTKLYLLIAPLGAAVLAGTACQTAQRPSSLLPPPQANPPALTTVASSKTPQGHANPAPIAQQAETRPELMVDPVADLIAKVEKEYAAGQANYQSGHLEAAKQNFDTAFNLLLSGPVEVKSDERLEREFEKLLDGVNGLELMALQEGDGFSEQKSEPAPIDEANEVTFPVDPNIKAKAEAEVKATRSDLPLVMNDEVAGYVNFYANTNRGRNTLEHAWTRGGRYREIIAG